MRGFWKKLKKPILALAPMADVTDAAFRRIIASQGKPDVMWTEFVSADGLFLGGREALLVDLQFSEMERPMVAQFFTATPSMMEKAASLARELGFDGVDINMGCPDRSVEKQGAGAALIKNPELAIEIIAAAKQGAKELPVSVKTRLGYSADTLETWLPALLKASPDAVTIHARTRKEMSKVPARWERIRRAVEIRNELSAETLILGNGDALSLSDAKEKAHVSGADGVMLGRAIFGNPWLFSPEGRAAVALSERLSMLIEHTQLFESMLGRHKNFAIMKKHYKAYVHGFDGAKELRMELMGCDSAQAVAKRVTAFLARA